MSRIREVNDSLISRKKDGPFDQLSSQKEEGEKDLQEVATCGM